MRGTSCHRRVMRRPRGFSVLELVIVIAIFGIVITVGWLTLRARPAVQVAREIATVVAHSRWTAVTTGRPIVLLLTDGGRSIVQSDLPGWGCVVGNVPRRVWEIGERRAFLTWPARGIAFAPDGFPRSCSGDGVGSATVRIDDAATRAAVIISSLGRVRWEPRP